jgi:hypothetical protein
VMCCLAGLPSEVEEPGKGRGQCGVKPDSCWPGSGPGKAPDGSCGTVDAVPHAVAAWVPVDGNTV